MSFQRLRPIRGECKAKGLDCEEGVMGGRGGVEDTSAVNINLLKIYGHTKLKFV